MSRLDFLEDMKVYILVVVAALILLLAFTSVLDMDDTKQQVPLTPEPQPALVEP